MEGIATYVLILHVVHTDIIDTLFRIAYFTLWSVTSQVPSRISIYRQAFNTRIFQLAVKDWDEDVYATGTKALISLAQDGMLNSPSCFEQEPYFFSREASRANITREFRISEIFSLELRLCYEYTN